MNLRIRRRRFGQLAIASAATAAIANLAGKTQAQTSEVLYAVGLSNSSSSGVAARPNVATTAPGIVLTSIDLASGKDISSSTIAARTVSNLDAIGDTVSRVTNLYRELITGLAVRPDGTLVNATVSNSINGNISRLSFTDPKSFQAQNSLNLTGLSNNTTVDSLLATNDNRLLSLISINGGSLSSFALATIDPTTGRVTSGADAGLPNLEAGRGFNTLAQSPDGSIYTITVGREGNAALAQVNLGNNSVNTLVELRYNGKPLQNGLLSLAISRSSQFYALANPRYEEINSLFTLDPKTGVLTLVRQLNADQIAFAK